MPSCMVRAFGGMVCGVVVRQDVISGVAQLISNTNMVLDNRAHFRLAQLPTIDKLQTGWG